MCLSYMVEHCGMELHKLHVGYCSLGTIHHGNAVACRDDGIGGCLIDSTAATCTHHRDLRQVGVHLLGIRVQHIGAIAVDIGGTTCHLSAKMVLGDDLHGKVVLLDIDVRTSAYGCHQAPLDLSSGIVGMVQDTELRVSSLAVQVEVALLVLIEVHPPVHQFLDL